MSNRIVKQPKSDQDDKGRAGGFKFRRTARATDGAPNDNKPGEHQHDRRANMGQYKDNACTQTGDDLRRPAEEIGNQHRLSVSWHECMNKAEEGGDADASQ